MSAALLPALALAVPSLAGAAVELSEGPPPWRSGGRVAFTLDAVSIPDSARLMLELNVRVPSATIRQLARSDSAGLRVRLDVRVRSRFGARTVQSSREFSIAEGDTALGLGKVVRLRFPTAPGVSQVYARLADIQSRKRGLFYSGRAVNEASELQGEVQVPAAQGGRWASDVRFLWPVAGAEADTAFERHGTRWLPNPDRLYGLLAGQLRAAFLVRSRPGDERPWHWVARVFDESGAGVTQVEGTGEASHVLDADLAMDVSKERAGAYDLDVKAWQEGDTGAVERRARFSIGWQPETWLRSSVDVADEVHLLFPAEDEDRFALVLPGAQERMIDDFWARRDPTPDTEANEALMTFRQRVAYANENFARGGIEKGMFSDMGRVYVRYGEPSEISRQVIPAGDQTLSEKIQEIIVAEDQGMEVHQKGPGGDMRPFEVWTYEGILPLPFDADPAASAAGGIHRRLLFLFVDEQDNGIYRLRFSNE